MKISIISAQRRMEKYGSSHGEEMRAVERQHWSGRDFKSATLSKVPYCVEIPVSFNVFKQSCPFCVLSRILFAQTGSSGNQLIVMSQRARP